MCTSLSICNTALSLYAERYAGGPSAYRRRTIYMDPTRAVIHICVYMPKKVLDVLRDRKRPTPIDKYILISHIGKSIQNPKHPNSTTNQNLFRRQGYIQYL